MPPKITILHDGSNMFMTMFPDLNNETNYLYSLHKV